MMLFVRFIAEHGTSRLLDHVGQLDKVFKIPPLPGKTQALSLRPLEEDIPGPSGPISQHGLVKVLCLRELGGLPSIRTWRNPVTAILSAKVAFGVFTPPSSPGRGFLETVRL